MADDALRMRAEVEDRFSGPLKALRAQLLDLGRTGPQKGEAVAKGLNKVEGAARSAGQAAQTVLNPALAAVGITGLTAGVAVAGISNALSRLSGNLVGLGQLGRETGMAAEQLRVFQSVAGKFGISSEQADAGAQAFARNMRDIRKGVGETMGFLQSQNPVVAQFALKLKGSKNNDEALKLTEEFMEQIPNAVDRGRFAEKLLGNSDFGRLGDRSKGRIRDLNTSTAEKLGPLDPKVVESAERYERALSDLRSSMQKVGTTIAMQILPSAERFTTWLDDIASGKRKELIDGLRQGMHEIGDELGKIDWAGAGESAKQMLLSTTALVKPVAESVKEIAAAIRSFNEGKTLEGLRHLDGGHGPLARRLAPLPGDEKYAREEQTVDLQKRIGIAKEQGGLQTDLLKELEERGDTEASKRLRAAMDENSRHLKALEDELRKLTEQGASVQKSSAEGNGSFGGARIQSAAYGGAGFRRMPNYRGSANLPGRNGYGDDPDAQIHGGPGGSGAFPEGRRAEMREAFRRYLMRRVPGYDGGPIVPTGPNGRLPSMGGRASRMPGLRAGGDASGISVTQKYPDGLAEGIQQTAKDLGISARDVGTAISYETGGTFDPWKRGPTTKWGQHRGLIQWGEPQRRRYGVTQDMTPGEQMQKVTQYLRDAGVRPGMGLSEIYSAINAGRVGRMGASDRPGFTVQRHVNEMQGPHGRRADRLLSALNSGERLQPLGRLQADGDGWAARERARKDFDAQQEQAQRMERSGARLTASAARAGIVSGPNIENNGSVYVNVQKAGPDARVTTSASGNLFKDVVLRRGRAMEKAEGS